ncbi:MAG: glycosyltransferase family A protein [Methylococcales bacterium]|nr:glycosyltransferase family A protein [Methylococcales bacterium]
MSSSPLFTVFTATYNRAYILSRVYESLKRQTLRDFEWLIVDDGSSDNTRQIVQAWCAEANFPIRYLWQENAHKKVAFNRGVREANGELFLALDNDDEALPEALATFKRIWFDIPDSDRNRYSAVTGLCIDPAGNIVGDRYPDDILDSTATELALRYRISGEKWGFQRVDVLREFPFPEDVVGWVPESIVWNRIARKYLTRYVNIPVRIFYPGGLSSDPDGAKRSDGRTLLARETLEYDWKWIFVNPLAILKEAVAYTFFSMHLAASQDGKQWPLKGLIPRLLVALMWPAGFVRYHISKWMSRHG